MPVCLNIIKFNCMYSFTRKILKEFGNHKRRVGNCGNSTA